MASDKYNYTKKMMNLATAMDNLSHEIEQANKTWAAKGYGAGGQDEIKETDIGTLPITIDSLQGLNYTFENFMTFLTNGTPTVGDYRVNLANGRNVEGEYVIVLPE